MVSGRPFVYLLLAYCCFFSLSSCATPKAVSSALPQQKSRPKVEAEDVEHRIHDLINKERRKQGLAVLRLEDTLGHIARKHSRDMAKRNYFEHYSPEGHDFSYRYRLEGFRCAVQAGGFIYTGAENIALNHLYDAVVTVNNESFYNWNSASKIAESTVHGWMESQGHRKNILTPQWKKEGIGVAITPDGKVFITQNFC